MYLSIIILPLLGSIVAGFFGRKVGISGSHIITCTCVIITTILAILAFVEVGFNNIPVLFELLKCKANIRFNTIYALKFNNFGTNQNVNYILNNKAYFFNK